MTDPVYQGIKDLATRHGRSMEAEARSILAEAAHAATWWDQWVAAAGEARGDDLPIPPRTPPRSIDL
jgi:plasmid stability protein